MTRLTHDKSRSEFARAKRLMPGGVNSAARAFGAVGGDPIVFERAQGAYLFDIDGNKYLDYIGSWGPMIFGHQLPAVSDAVHAAVDRGTSFGAPTVAENELAELIIEAVPSVEMVRLVNSGTEATMSAIRLARGFTGRDIIIKFAGNYHGHVDSLLVAAGSAAATLAVPNSPGVTEGTSKDTLVLGYNETPDFLRSLRTSCDGSGSVLIFDEVMCGFRVAHGGAQSLFDVTPDLTTMGKIVGGGLPLGAFAGKREIMKHVLPSGKVFQAGTLSGNPIATAAGIAMLRSLRDNPPYTKLESLSKRLADGLSAAAQSVGVEHCLQRVGSMMTLFFNPGPVTDWETASKSDTQKFSRYFWGLIDRGVYMPCSQFEALFVSAAHTEADIDMTIAAAKEVLSEI